jgi:hypothetical protein
MMWTLAIDDASLSLRLEYDLLPVEANPLPADRKHGLKTLALDANLRWLALLHAGDEEEALIAGT